MEQLTIYVGTNYHPHDWDKERWVKDLDMMQEASFHIIRIGHLCWDSFEPREGEYCFLWLDTIMELCNRRDIKVFLDIPTRPAPVWLHQKYPSIDIVDVNGIRQDAHSRYMEDIGDPFFQEYALKLADRIVRRYKEHPALLGFGLCNELGAGYNSYSESARLRFVEWLRLKYKEIEVLNHAWATQRWSRRIGQFSDITFPVCGLMKGAPERYLDMKRFFSDEILDYLQVLHDCVKNQAPNVSVSTNHWAENPNVGFDYQKGYETWIDYPGQGFYPGVNPEFEDGYIGACMYTDYRIGELNKPMWCLEFQTGTFGGYSCPRNVMRMYAYLSYVYRSELTCAWTWRSMYGGEEQYLFGLLEHDGKPSWKYEEFRQLAKEAEQLSKYRLFPRKTEPNIAIAYSYESQLISEYAADYYKTAYTQHVMAVYRTLFHLNIDCNIVDLHHVRRKYSVIIIPGHCIMDATCASAVRTLVAEGTTVIMTAYSAKVNEYNQVFKTSFPGSLTDVFGINIGEFQRAHTHVASVNEGGLAKQELWLQRQTVDICIDDKCLGCDIDYYETITLREAIPFAVYTNTDVTEKTAISCNDYGKGKAIYMGIPADEKVLRRLLMEYCDASVWVSGIALQKGLVSRMLDENTQIFINTNEETVAIETTQHSVFRSIFTEERYESIFKLGGYGVEILRAD